MFLFFIYFLFVFFLFFFFSFVFMFFLFFEKWKIRLQTARRRLFAMIFLLFATPAVVLA